MMMNDKFKTILIGLLLVGLVTMTVAYATLFQNLSINGSAKLQPGSSSWNLHFANLSSGSTTGTASIETGKELAITGTTTLSGLTGNLSAKGDSIIYTFDIVNDGDVAAKISSINMPNLNTAVTYSETSSDAQTVKPNIIYRLQYTSNNADLAINDTLAAHSSVNVRLTISYNQAASGLPDNDVYINDLITEINYIQA